MRWLARSVGARVFATLDTEEYLDFQAARPTVELVDGVSATIQWPALAFSAGSLPGGGRDLVLLLGVEPNLRWPTFCDDVISRRAHDGLRDGRDARRAARRRAALAADPLHRLGDRRGARGAARHAALALRRPDRHRRRAARRGAPGRLRVGVDLGAGAALRRDRARTRRRRARCSTGSATLLDLGLDLTDLDIAASAWERSVAEVVAGDADASSYVERLEARYDETARPSAEPTTDRPIDDDDDDDEDWLDEDDLPSGESLAEDFERYLREQGDDCSSAPRQRPSESRGRGRPRGGSRARATRCRRARRCRGTSTRSRRTRACG